MYFKEREKKGLTPANSFSLNACNSWGWGWGWATSKQGVKELHLSLSHGQQGPEHLSGHCCSQGML